MSESENILAHIRLSAVKKILFLPHAIRQMSKPERMISTADIRHVIQTGEIIEDYPDDARGYSCLLLGFIGTYPLHVVCAAKNDYLAIITAYLPSAKEWVAGYRKRKKR